jgi:hypothetical protein
LTEKSSFFNSVAGDRKYQASDFASYFNSLLTNGVFPNPSTNLQVISNSNMTVTVSIGKGWINGYFYFNDAILILPIEVADGTLNRIDRIVLQFNTTGRAITAKVKKGTFSSSPVAPVLQRDADAYELALADVYVGAGVTSIAGANITDQRMTTSLCGIVNSLITADTTTLFTQYSDGFNTWFNGIKGLLVGDPATNLTNQIITLEGAGWTTETVKGNATALTTHRADYVRQPGYVNPTAGTLIAYTGGTTPTLATYSEGVGITIVPHVVCGAAPTFAWGALAAVPLLKQDGTTFAAGDMVAGKPYTFKYVGTSFLADSSGAIKIAGQTEITAKFAGAISKNDPVYLNQIYCQDTSTKLTNPATLPASTGYGVAFSADGVYMSVASSASPLIIIYKRSGDVFTKLADPAILPAGAGNGVAFSADGTYMAVASGVSPYITIYKRSGDVFTKLASPATLPAGYGYGVAFSADGVYMAVAHDVSPYITIYKGGTYLGVFAHKSSNLLVELVNVFGAGYAEESGVLNDSKKVIQLWG